MIRDSTKCKLCARSFRSVQALLKHVETSHSEVPTEELAHYKLSLMNHPLLMAGLSGQILDSTNNDLLRKEGKTDQENPDQDGQERDQEIQEMEPAAKKSLLMSTFSRCQSGELIIYTD